MKIIVAMCVLGLLVMAGAQNALPTNYEELLSTAAAKFGAHVADIEMPSIDWNNITTIALDFGGGFLSGMFERMNDTDGKRCFDNIKNVTAVINYVQYIIAHGLEKQLWPMVRQILVLGVMVLNVTIDELIYCTGLYYLYMGFYNTTRCVLNCKEQYYVILANRILKRSYDYLYYGKESVREFTNGNYHLSGNWFAYTLDNVFMLYGGCQYYNGVCYVPPDPDPTP